MVLTPKKDMEATSDEASGRSGFDSSDDEEEEDLSPFQVSWLQLGTSESDGVIAISGLPGRRFKDTWRNLENDIKCLRGEGIEEVFTLCSKGELNKYRVPWLLSELTGADMVVHHYPFMDGQVPTMTSLVKMIDEIRAAARSGRKALVHCFGGLGRSCLVAVCVMLMNDESLEPETAIAKVREVRGPGAIQSIKQFHFVSDFRELYREYKKDNDTDQRSISR